MVFSRIAMAKKNILSWDDLGKDGMSELSKDKLKFLFENYIIC